jgi:hypothetical protein
VNFSAIFLGDLPIFQYRAYTSIYSIKVTGITCEAAVNAL